MLTDKPYFLSTLRRPFRVGVSVYSLFLIWVSLRPAGTGGAIPHFDKILHLCVYAFLAGGLALAWPKLSKFRVFWMCVIFGALLEIAQGLMGSGRTASFWDGLANSFGALLGVYAAVLVERFIAH